MYFGATCLSQRLDWTSALPLVFPVRQRRVFMKYHTSILPYEYTLSLKALFAPEVDGRGALGISADAVEAIFCKVQIDNLLVLVLGIAELKRLGPGRCGPILAVLT
jgi:hypothetical protein